jgi:hypothetical protein
MPARKRVRSCRRQLLRLAVAVLATLPVSALGQVGPGDQGARLISATVTVDAGAVLRDMNPRMLGSTNAAFWTNEMYFASPVVNQWLRELGPGLIRIPGGSYADHIYWNGHGVRGPDGKVDPTRMKDGYPDVNYSDGIYETSFTADRMTRTPGQSAAQNVDVKRMHEFIQSIPGTGTLAIANAGTGRPVDAAEWVRWANLKMGYNVRYWEIGNELDGDWEPGHILPDGRHLTGEMYAARFHEFAAAMKAVDPTIKVGGAAGGTGENSFNRDMLRLAGDDVDFVSIHNYWGTRMMSVDAALQNLTASMAKEVSYAKRWVEEYQPARKDKIEIIYTEWNLSNQTGPFCSDMFSAIWATHFLAEAALNGVTAANQWDLFTHGDGPGFAMIHYDAGQKQFWRKSQYYALQLWNNYMGHQLLSTVSSGSPRVKTLASRSDDDVRVMLLNTDPECDAEVTLSLGDFDAAVTGEMASLTSREYFWPPNARKPLWSEGIRPEPVTTGKAFAVTLPPFSIRYLRIPRAGTDSAQRLAARRTAAPGAVDPPQLRILIEPEVYAGDVIDGFVIATLPGTDKPYPLPLPPARLSASGPAEFGRAEARLAEAVGHFTVTPREPGDLRITAACEGAKTSAAVKVKPSVPRPVVFWDFRNPIATDQKAFASDWQLAHDEGVRPNKGVARVDFPPEGSLPGGSRAPRAALIVKSLPAPEVLNRANVRGVIFDAMLSPDFRTDDPNASLQVVMQTPLHGYWMPIGSVSLRNLADGRWHSETLSVTDEVLIKAMEGIYNVWFVVSSATPVKGSIYFDQIGLLVR